MSDVIQILVSYREGIVHGLLTTLQLVSIAWSAGLVLGTLVGYLSWRSPAWHTGLRGWTFFLSSIPVLVLLFWVHYPLQQAFQVTIAPFASAAAVLSVLTVAAVADVVRHALRNLDQEYVRAGIVCGLAPGQIFRYIQVPIFLRQVVPSLLRIQVGTLHMTLFASLISVDEIFRIAQRINAQTYKPIAVFTMLAILFLLISLPLNGLAAYLEKRFHGGLVDS